MSNEQILRPLAPIKKGDAEVFPVGKKIQKIIDGFWQKTLFKVLPSAITPNLFSFTRLILILAILYFLALGNFVLSLVFFVLAALCDSIDGALARTRKMISALGLIIDPVADKLLIIMITLFLFYYYPAPRLLLLLITIEVLILANGLVFLALAKEKRMLAADFWGKVKMFFQALAVIAALIWLIFNLAWLLILSLILFFIAIIFGLVSLFNYLFKAIYLP